jgi:hypothetical protein
MIDTTVWTNVPEIWDKNQCFQHKTILWFMYSTRRYRLEELYQLESWKSAKHIFLVDNEALDIKKCLDADSRIHFWSPSILDHARFHSNLFWFNLCREIEENLRYSNNLISHEEVKDKEFIFECMFGVMENRPNKIWVKEKIENCKSQEQFLVGARSRPHFIGNRQPDALRLFDDWVDGNGHERTTGIYVDQVQVSPSWTLPYKIYNRTWYSVVCETFSNKIFYSEKIAKPLLGRRLFVLFGAQHMLKNLKNFGYKTFDCVIDESYDNIANNHDRWQMAWDQIEYLTNQDPQQVYEKIQPILDHNCNLIMHQNWKDMLNNQIQQIQVS